VQECQLKPDAQRYTKITVAQADQVTKLPFLDEPVVDASPTPPAAAVIRVDEPDDPIEEPIEEPVVRKVTKDPKPIKDDIADVLSAWADDE
jgi:hypothetical protein